MGSVLVSGKFQAYDWQSGIKMLQEASRGNHSDCYDMSIADVNFRYVGDKSFLSLGELEAFKKSLHLNKYEGAVYKLSIKEYEVISTEYSSMAHHALYDNVHVKQALRNSKKPAVLVQWDEMRAKFICDGTLPDLKNKAHNMLRDCNYSICLYIVRKSGEVITCSRSVKKYKSTSKVSNDRQLVLQLGVYGYTCWAPM